MGPDGNVELGLNAARAPGPTRSPLGRAGFVAVTAVLAVAALFSPVKLCLMAVVLHVPCPGCGMTRATNALLHGDLARAFALHPLSPVIVPLTATLLASQAVRYVRHGAPLGAGRVPRSLEITLAALTALLLGVWMARFFGCFGGPVSLH